MREERRDHLKKKKVKKGKIERKKKLRKRTLECLMISLMFGRGMAAASSIAIRSAL